MSVVYIVIILLLIAVDQVTKFAVISWLKPQGTLEIIPGFIRFRYVENDGAAFSMLQNARWFFIILTTVFVIIGLVCLLSGKMKFRYPTLHSPFIKTAIILICAGGIGNMIDRLFRGVVIDFIEPTFVNFAVFNFADILVTCGAAIIIIYLVADVIFDFTQKKREIRDYKKRRKHR
ncbi:MAG: signal peptidase II [Clostridia bacterium]|nr:signal peptidase II [Clostridia bacterium]